MQYRLPYSTQRSGLTLLKGTQEARKPHEILRKRSAVKFSTIQIPPQSIPIIFIDYFSTLNSLLNPNQLDRNEKKITHGHGRWRTHLFHRPRTSQSRRN